MHSHLDISLQKKLKKRANENSLRVLGGETNLVDFYSNDYLGFARSQELYTAISEKINQLPHRNGATGSRLLSGNDPYTENVERQLALHFKSEACLILNSGYSANLAILSSLPQRGDTILYDELVHTSIKDGARLSLASRVSFKHNDTEDLEKKLHRVKGNSFILLESVYSMDGDSPDIKHIVNLAHRYNATIIVDEAHSTGIQGPDGSGLSIAAGLHEGIPVRLYTFGKAMGIHGACVCGSKILIDYLINFARPLIYTTALPPHSIVSIDCAFNYLKQNNSLIDRLDENIRHFLDKANSSGIDCTRNHSPIQTILTPGNNNAKRTASHLQQSGLDIRPILSPTVKEGSERLRICLHNFNTKNEIDHLVNSLSGLPIA